MMQRYWFLGFVLVAVGCASDSRSDGDSAAGPGTDQDTQASSSDAPDAGELGTAGDAPSDGDLASDAGTSPEGMTPMEDMAGSNDGMAPVEFELGSPDDDGGDVPADAVLPFYEADCRLAIRCGLTVKSQEECELPYRQSCAPDDAVFAPSESDLQACAEMLDGMACEDASGLPPGPCFKVVAAMNGDEVVETGEPCGGLPRRICPLSDFCVVDDAVCGMGTCVAAPVAGETCLQGQCGPGLLCDTGVCTEPVLASEGQPCNNGLPCGRGLFCESNECVPALASGEACDASAQCDADLLCLDGTCGYLPVTCDAGAAGEPCTIGGWCAEGTACVQGTCEPAPGEGEECRGDGDVCAVGTLCVPTRPDGSTWECAALKDPGEPCNLSPQCRSGACFACEMGQDDCEEGFCAGLDLGQRCDNDEECYTRNCVAGFCGLVIGDSCEWAP